MLVLSIVIAGLFGLAISAVIPRPWSTALAGGIGGLIGALCVRYARREGNGLNPFSR